MKNAAFLRDTQAKWIAPILASFYSSIESHFITSKENRGWERERETIVKRILIKLKKKESRSLHVYRLGCPSQSRSSSFVFLTLNEIYWFGDFLPKFYPLPLQMAFIVLVCRAWFHCLKLQRQWNSSQKMSSFHYIRWNFDIDTHTLCLWPFKHSILNRKDWVKRRKR